MSIFEILKFNKDKDTIMYQPWHPDTIHHFRGQGSLDL